MEKILIVFLIITSTIVFVGCSNKAKSNLVLHYKFNETSGEEALETIKGKSNHVNYVYNRKNQPLLYQEAKDPEWRKNGIKDGALWFDGYSTYIVDQGFKMPTKEFTISLWVAPRAFEWGDGGNLSAFVSQSNFDEHEGFAFGMYRLGEWGIKLGLGNEFIKGVKSISAPEEYYLKPMEWNYVAVSFDQKFVTLYYNGEIAIKEPLGDYENYEMRKAIYESFLIGKYSRNEKVAVFDVNMFNGLMDDLKVYDEALKSETIKASYENYLIKHNNRIPVIADEDIELNHAMYASDRNRPQFHAIPAGHWMNEPHAPIYFNGYYHLFYQHNPTGPFWHQIHWGHWVSKDMINWEDVGVAIRPHQPVTPDGVWSGAASYDLNGNPILFITAGNDSKQPNQSIALCRPVDLKDSTLKDWSCDDAPAIEQTANTGKFGEFRDPFVFKVDDTWFTLIGSGTKNNSGGTALIYSSKDLKDFDYMGEFFVADFQRYNYIGLHWELPIFLPLRDQFGNETDKWIFGVSPHPVSLSDVEVFYWIGEFDKEMGKFIPDHSEPRLIDHGDGVFTGPSGFVDPKTGRSIIFTIAQGVGSNSWQDYYSGWAHTAGMPISVWYNSETAELNFEPIEEIKNARDKELLKLSNVSVDEVNHELKNISGDLLEIVIEIDAKDAESFGINFRESTTEVTSVTYNTVKNRMIYNSIRSSEKAIGYQREISKELDNHNLRLHILLDRSLVEVYMNDLASITSRIYPVSKASQGLSLFEKNGSIEIINLEIYEMKSVYLTETVDGYYQQ